EPDCIPEAFCVSDAEDTVSIVDQDNPRLGLGLRSEAVMLLILRRDLGFLCSRSLHPHLVRVVACQLSEETLFAGAVLLCVAYRTKTKKYLPFGCLVSGLCKMETADYPDYIFLSLTTDAVRVRTDFYIIEVRLFFGEHLVEHIFIAHLPNLSDAVNRHSAFATRCSIFPAAMDSIRDPAELRQALQFIYNTEAQQLATVMRAGPGEGRSKLLLAITLSTDSALRFHYDSQAESSTDKGAGKGKDPVRRTDNSTSTDPIHSVQGDATVADPPKPVEVPPSTSSTTPSTSLPAESPAGSTSTPGTGGRPKLDLVDVIMSTTLSDIFKEEKVPSDLAAELSKILTIHSFACIASSADQIEESVKEAVPGALHSLMTPVCIACLKAAYHRCLTHLVSVGSSPSTSTPVPASSLASSSTWNETFPAKLGHDKVSTLKTKFEADYPSEILDHSTMPSSRLLASVNKQCQEKHYSYVAWKHRISEEKLDEMHSNRPRKIARFDDFIFDEVPFREIPESGISQMFLLHLLDLLAFAFCLLEAAHLSSFRSYSKLFLKLAFQKQAGDSGLRPPNVHEMQLADKEAWRCICDLANSGWSLDDALHEVVQVFPSSEISASAGGISSARHFYIPSNKVLPVAW
ncbi:unnamed protein product, partial [Symbiodinium microadriaticum]